MADELEFIELLTRRFPPQYPVLTGIGDDGAVLDCRDDSRSVVVTDMLLDGVHFDLSSATPEQIGRKAVAVNLSDLAAMACYPRAAFICIALPAKQPGGMKADFPVRLYDGMQQIAEEFSFSIAGGDTNSWQGPFAISVCIAGTPMSGEPILRQGGKPGQSLIVTGPLGGSLRRGRHLTFTPRLAVAEWLVRNTRPSAMMDISDGLATDLPRLAHQCQLAVELDETRLPIHADVPADAAERHRIAAALTDGEDFELVFAIDQKVAGSLDSVPRDLGVSFTAIGSLQPGQGCFITDARGVRQPLSVSGYRHSF